MADDIAFEVKGSRASFVEFVMALLAKRSAEDRAILSSDLPYRIVKEHLKPLNMADRVAELGRVQANLSRLLHDIAS